MLWNVHFKKKRKGKKKLCIPCSSAFLFFSSISRISCFFSVFFLRKLKEKQICPLQKHSSVYILQPARVLFTNHTKKNNNKSCIIRLPVFAASPNVSLFAGFKQKINRVDWESSDRQPTQCPNLLTVNHMLTDRRWKQMPCELILCRPGANECPTSGPNWSYWTLYL